MTVADTVFANARRAAGVQTLVALLSGRLRLSSLLERIGRWAAATTTVQVFLQCVLQTDALRFVCAPGLRALAGHVWLSRNTQMWVLCDAAAHLIASGCPTFRGKNVLLCGLASAEILTNWIRAPDLLLPGYKKYLDWQGMADEQRTAHRAVVERRNVLGIVMPRGVVAWTLRHLATRSVPFYAALKGAQALLTWRTFDVRGVATSSAFLTAYCGGAWIALQALPWIRVATALPGLALALEPSRAVRVAIRHYCLIMALYCRLKNVQVPAVGVVVAGSLQLPNHAMLNSL